MSRRKSKKWEFDVAKRVRQMQARQGMQSASKKESKAKFDREHWQQIAADEYAKFHIELREWMGEKRSVEEIAAKYGELKTRLRRRVKHKETLQFSFAKINGAIAEMKVFAMIPKQKEPERN